MIKHYSSESPESFSFNEDDFVGRSSHIKMADTNDVHDKMMCVLLNDAVDRFNNHKDNDDAEWKVMWNLAVEDDKATFVVFRRAPEADGYVKTKRLYVVEAAFPNMEMLHALQKTVQTTTVMKNQ